MSKQHAPRLTFDASRFTFHAILLLAFALRLYRLDAQPIWWDEAISIHLANSGLLAILADRVTHVHPPLYFVLLKGWVGLAGDGAFSVRFFSAALNTLLVPAVYAFARRWFDRHVGLWAALAAALSPLYVIYSQETRVYAILPLLYLALLALVHRLTSPSPTVRYWLLLVLVQAVGLYLHYVFVLAVAYVNLWLLVSLWRRSHQRRYWAFSLGATFLTCLPWAIAVLFNWSAVLSDVAGSDPFAEPIPFDHFVRLLWTFQWAGLTAALNDATLMAVVALLAVLLAMALTVLLAAAATRRPALTLLAHWLAPLAGALLMWQAKPLSHPRYVALFAVAALLLCGYGLARLPAGGAWRKGLAVLLGVTLLGSSALSLRGYFFDPRYGKDDTRGAAAAIAARSAPGDLLLVPPEDWSVPYYYRGPARVEMVRSGDIARLAALTAANQTVFLVDTNRATHDPGHCTAFALESAGSLTDRWDFKGLNVRVYRLERGVSGPDLPPVEARFGPLRLTGAWLEPGAPSDTAVAVALRWEALEPSSAPLRVGLRLLDPDGWAWATADDWLLDGRVQRTDHWSVGQAVTTCHVLPLPPGAPPLSYTLSLGVYERDGEVLRPLERLDPAGNPQGQSFDLGEVTLGAPIGVEGDPYRVAERAPLWTAPVAVGSGVSLTGAALDRAAAAPGQPVYVTLRWSAGALPDSRSLPAPVLTLEQGGAVLATAEAPAGGRYPPERWVPGQTVVEHRRLVVPPAAGEGTAAVILQVGEQVVEVGHIEVNAGEHLFEPPPMSGEVGVRFGDVAELLGYDLEQTAVMAGQPVTITLYWRALEGAGAADYTVFTHILAADGHLVGQHDGPPAGGGRPTPGWLPGEIVVDRHPMTFREAYSGTARIEVGLYDPVGVVRVPAAGGETAVILPDLLSVRLP